MIVGVPREIKEDEGRVAIVPSGVSAFIAHGHTVLVEQGAGLGSGIPDAAYRAAGATIVKQAKSVWERADMVMKVKEPLGDELKWIQLGQILYTYLHLASNEALTRALVEKKIVGMAYETIQTADGSLPLLVPMSEVAGRLAIQKGAFCLEAASKGCGILLSGVSGRQARQSRDPRRRGIRQQRLSGGGRHRRPRDGARRESAAASLSARRHGRRRDDDHVQRRHHCR